MTRTEQAERRTKAVELYEAGVRADEIAKRLGITVEYVWQLTKDKRNIRIGIDVLRANKKEIIELLDAGIPYKEIGAIYNVSRNVVREFCKENNMSRGGFNDEDTVSRNIAEKTRGLYEYISGYTKKESPVKVRCTICGGELELTYHHLTTKTSLSCPLCRERERAIKAAEQSQRREEAKAERAYRRAKKEELESQRRAAMIHTCLVCGRETSRPKYCCQECANKAYNKAKETRRREKIESAMVDNDITVEGLFRRDAGKCWLCGERCNFEDYTVKAGNFIVGNWYPSIDHVIPLARGGEHSWGNVRLAHHRCNSIKRDNIV